eukprot:scaffold8058_cov134-Isochrysis_galbana.AAC.3
MTPGSSRCVFRASAGLNRAFPSLVLFGGILHSSLHAPLSSCSRPRHAGSRKASTLVTVQLHGVSRRSRQPCAPSCRASRRLVFACLHSQRCVASWGAVNSVVCLANT